MIFDSTYTEEEISSRVGWGHSTWQQGLRLAEAAGAKVFCLFHHDPDRDDRAMDGLAAAVDAARTGTIVAREGLVVDLSGCGVQPCHVGASADVIRHLALRQS